MEEERSCDLSNTSTRPQFRATSLGSLGSAPRSEVHDNSDEEFSSEQSADVRAEWDGSAESAERAAVRVELWKYLYIQMELCKCESLDGWLKRDNERIAEIIKPEPSSSVSNGSQLKQLIGVQMRDRHFVFLVFSQMVSAITYIHSQELIHRDLKVSLCG